MNLEVIILAAGQGSRMQSDLPKVLHQVAGKAMLSHVLDTATGLGAAQLHVVVGHGSEQVQEALADKEVNWVLQEQQLGTGHAVLQALPQVAEDAVVLVLYGDVPLITVDSLKPLVAAAKSGPALLTAVLPDATGYGRVVRNAAGDLQAVVEDRDASAEQRLICEINTGVLAAPASFLRDFLPRVRNENSQNEYYLPDVLSMQVEAGAKVATCESQTAVEIEGVNNRSQLSRVEREFQQRLAQQLLLQGVGIADPARLDVRGSLRCGRNVFIDVNVVVEGDVVLGDNVSIGPNCVIIDSVIEAGSTIHAMSHLQEAKIGSDCNVGPYARLRSGTDLSTGAKVGNFVETKKAKIGQGSKVNHLSYIGDCSMGAGVNVGAGTITCNYDGVNKYQTELGDGVFIGSNSTLVAPLTVQAQGFVAAGSTITKTVEEDELAVARGRQRNIQGWQRPQANKGQS